MRNLLIACLFLLAAMGLGACSDPVRNARRTVGVIEATTAAAELDVARGARTVILDLAEAEGHRRGAELRAAGCGPACATQPSTALIDPCKGVVAASEARLAAEVKRVQDAQRRADGALDGVYATLRAVVKFLRVLTDPRPDGWEATLAALVGAAVKSSADCAAAVAGFKQAIKGGAK